MADRTTAFLVWLSHGGQVIALLAPGFCGAVFYSAGAWKARAMRGHSVKALQSAIMARAASGVILATSVAFAALSFFHVGCARAVSSQTRCASNVKLLGFGVLMYSNDNDEVMPAADRWSEVISPYLKEGDDVFHCPAAETPWSYGFNGEMSLVDSSRLPESANTVLLFEADCAARPFSGTSIDLAVKRHFGAPVIGFADGHVERANAVRRANFAWTPKLEPLQNPPEKTEQK